MVEPVAPFLTAEIAAGVDGFFQARLLAEFQLLSPERQAKVLPFIVTWCRRAEQLSAADAARNLALVMLMREKAVAATEPYDFLITPTSPITAYAAEEATPGNDPFKPFEHIGFTVPFNMSEQPAASICAGYDADGMPIGLQIVGHRFDDIGVLRTGERLRGDAAGATGMAGGVSEPPSNGPAGARTPPAFCVIAYVGSVPEASEFQGAVGLSKRR